MDTSDKNLIGIVADPKFATHLTGFGHPESPKRAQVIEKLLGDSEILTARNTIVPRIANETDLMLAHSAEYIALVAKEVSQCHGDEVKMLSTGDAMISESSYEVAKLAAGGILNAIDAVMSGQFQSAFAIVRPPGHHACRSIGMGFCLFNNVALGAFYILKNYPEIKRVLIVDWDLHHGNGTEDLVKTDPRIFYFSTHQSPLWPGTGSKEEKGCGNICNIPIMGGKTSRQAILDAYEYQLPHAMKAFLPDFILISAGFDAHKNDPLGNLELETEDFATLTQSVKLIADRYAKGRIVSALEGGYHLQALAESALQHVKNL